jgi:hypothetical protein
VPFASYEQGFNNGKKFVQNENRKENRYKNQLAAKTAEFENHADELATIVREEKNLESRMPDVPLQQPTQPLVQVDIEQL